MLKLRQYFFLPMVFSSAVLWGFTPSVTAANYHADGAIVEIFNGHFNTLDSYSLDLGVQAGRGVTYNVSGAHAQANSLAEGYGVHSHTYSQLTIPVIGGSYEIDAAATAIATFSDVMVSGPLGGTVTTSINLDLSGGSLVGSAADAGSLGYANTNLSIWVYVNGTVVGSGYRYDRADTRFGPSISSNGMLSSWGAANPTLVTSSFNVQSGVPFEVKLRLTTDADTVISSGNGAGGSAEANADYSHTFTLALSGPVFNLPSGYTAASAEAHIANNQAVPAGVPGDYNQNGIVDAADYVAWRKGVGTTYTQADYDTWRANFGHAAGSEASNVGDTLTAVPEPSTAALLIVSSILCLILRAPLSSPMHEEKTRIAKTFKQKERPMKSICNLWQCRLPRQIVLSGAPAALSKSP
jgi:hypothetical protein